MTTTVQSVRALGICKLAGVRSITLELDLPGSTAVLERILPYLEHVMCNVPTGTRTLTLVLAWSVPPSPAVMDFLVTEQDMWSRVASAIADSALSSLSIRFAHANPGGPPIVLPWGARYAARFRRVFEHSKGMYVVWHRRLVAQLIYLALEQGMSLQL